MASLHQQQDEKKKASELPAFSTAELQRHTSPDDLWISINDQDEATSRPSIKISRDSSK